MDIPTLETERLILRAPEHGDWPAYWQLMQSDRSIGMGGPFSLVRAWGMFCHDAVQWHLFGHGALMLVERGSGQCVGQVCLNAGPLFPETELGWFVYPHAEGRGLAFEGARALRDWAFGSRALKTLVSYVDAENLRSCRLAERLGATLDPKAPRNAPEDLVYRHRCP